MPSTGHDVRSPDSSRMAITSLTKDLPSGIRRDISADRSILNDENTALSDNNDNNDKKKKKKKNSDIDNNGDRNMNNNNSSNKSTSASLSNHNNSSSNSPNGSQYTRETSHDNENSHNEEQEYEDEAHKRRVARRACLNCRRKKVKCDGELIAQEQGTQAKCTRCRNLHLPCEFIASLRGGRRKKKRLSSSASSIIYEDEDNDNERTDRYSYYNVSRLSSEPDILSSNKSSTRNNNNNNNGSNNNNNNNNSHNHPLIQRLSSNPPFLSTPARSIPDDTQSLNFDTLSYSTNESARQNDLRLSSPFGANQQRNHNQNQNQYSPSSLKRDLENSNMTVSQLNEKVKQLERDAKYYRQFRQEDHYFDDRSSMMHPPGPGPGPPSLHAPPPPSHPPGMLGPPPPLPPFGGPPHLPPHHFYGRRGRHHHPFYSRHGGPPPMHPPPPFHHGPPHHPGAGPPHHRGHRHHHPFGPPSPPPPPPPFHHYGSPIPPPLKSLPLSEALEEDRLSPALLPPTAVSAASTASASAGPFSSASGDQPGRGPGAGYGTLQADERVPLPAFGRDSSDKTDSMSSSSVSAAMRARQLQNRKTADLYPSRYSQSLEKPTTVLPSAANLLSVSSEYEYDKNSDTASHRDYVSNYKERDPFVRRDISGSFHERSKAGNTSDTISERYYNKIESLLRKSNSDNRSLKDIEMLSTPKRSRSRSDKALSTDIMPPITAVTTTTPAVPMANNSSLLQSVISEKHRILFKLPSYGNIGLLVDLYYRYINPTKDLLPPKHQFLTDLHFPQNLSLIYAIFASSAACINSNSRKDQIDQRFKDPEYWLLYVNKYWNYADEMTIFTTLNVLATGYTDTQNLKSANLSGLVLRNVKILLQCANATSTNSNNLLSSKFLASCTSMRQFVDRLTLVKNVWHSWRFQLFYRVKKGFPFNKHETLKDTDIMFPESLPLPPSNENFVEYYKHFDYNFFSDKNSKQNEFLKIYYYNDMEKIINSLSSDLIFESSDEKFLAGWQNDSKPEYADYKTLIHSSSAVIVFAVRILEQIVEHISNYSLTKRNFVLFNSRIKVLELLLPSVYSIQNRNLLTIDGSHLLVKLTLSASKIFSKQLFCSEFLLFKDVSKLLNEEYQDSNSSNHSSNSTGSNHDDTLNSLRDVYQRIPLPMIHLICKNSTAAQLMDFAQLIHPCFELFEIIELGQGICKESLDIGINYPAIVGPTTLALTSDLSEDLYNVADTDDGVSDTKNYSGSDSARNALATFMGKPWWSFELENRINKSNKTGINYSSSFPDSWLQYPQVADLVIISAGLVLASSLLLCKFVYFRKSDEQQFSNAGDTSNSANGDRVLVDVFLKGAENEALAELATTKLHTIQIPASQVTALISQFSKPSLIEVLNLFCDFLKLRSKCSKDIEVSWMVLRDIKDYCMKVA